MFTQDLKKDSKLTFSAVKVNTIEVRSCNLYSPEIPTVLLTGVVDYRLKLNLIEIYPSHLRVKELDPSLFVNLLDDPKIQDIKNQKKLLTECGDMLFTYYSRFSGDLEGRAIGLEPMTKTIWYIPPHQNIDLQKVNLLIDSKFENVVKENIVMSDDCSSKQRNRFPVVLIKDPHTINSGEKYPFLITKPAGMDYYNLSIGGKGGHGNIGLALTLSYSRVLNANSKGESIIQIDGHAQILEDGWLHLSVRDVINKYVKSCWIEVIGSMKESVRELGFTKFTAGYPKESTIKFL